MKKFYLLFLAGALLFSCAKDDNKAQGDDNGEKGKVSFVLKGYNSPETKVIGNPGSQITDPKALDSLIKNVRILVFTPTSGGVCTAYADFDNIRLSQDNVLDMSVPTGVQDFMILTNVLGPVMTTTTSPMTIPTVPTGKTRAEILATLPASTGTLVTAPAGQLFGQAAQIFCDELNGVSITTGTTTNENVALVRLISQLSTQVDPTMVYDATGVTHYPTYITSLERVILRNVTPDINLTRLPNNRVASGISASSIFLAGNDLWSPLPAPSTLRVNNLLSFPNEPVGLKPFVIIEALVSPAVVPPYIADPANPTNYTRYWALQVPNKYLRQNVILRLTINKLLGPGSLTPPVPGESSTCEFTVEVYDWDGNIDTDSGDATSN